MVEEEQMLNKPKRIALCLFGHMRTWDKTWQSLFKYIVEPNEACGFQVDIFIHTWDELETCEKTWHSANKAIAGLELTEKVQDAIKDIYKPKKICVEHLNLQNGMKASIANVNGLCMEYAKENNIQYDFYIYTRPDITFLSPMVIERYMVPYTKSEELKDFQLPDKFLFVGSSEFQRFPFIDPRHIAEGNIIWFTNFEEPIYPIGKSEVLKIPIDYILYKDFTFQRTDTLPVTTHKVKFGKRLLSCFIPIKRKKRKIRGEIDV